MPETIPSPQSDNIEDYRPHLPDWIVEQLSSAPIAENSRFNSLLRQGTISQQGAAEKFIEMCESFPDSSLPELVRHVETIEQITVDFQGEPSKEQPGYRSPFSPDFERSRLVLPGLMAVPIADRNSLRDYLRGDPVSVALDAHMELNSLYAKKAKYIDPDKVERTSNDRSIGPRISDLPATFEPMPAWELFDTIQERYEEKDNQEKYINPEDTIKDIVIESTDESLIPLLLRLEEAFFETTANGSSRSIIRDTKPRKYFVENGIVWQLHTISSIRDQLGAECKPDVSGFDESNFDFVNFTQFYIAEYVEKIHPVDEQSPDEDESLRERLKADLEEVLENKINARLARKNGPIQTQFRN